MARRHRVSFLDDISISQFSLFFISARMQAEECDRMSDWAAARELGLGLEPVSQSVCAMARASNAVSGSECRVRLGCDTALS